MSRDFAHYMVLGHSPWLSTWHENSCSLIIPLDEFDINTYGNFKSEKLFSKGDYIDFLVNTYCERSENIEY
jgi:hypothetical protein